MTLIVSDGSVKTADEQTQDEHGLSRQQRLHHHPSAPGGFERYQCSGSSKIDADPENQKLQIRILGSKQFSN